VTVEAVPCDLSRLADVRAAAATAKDLLARGAVRPLRVLVANAGVYPADTRIASSDGYQMTFAINYLAHAQLIGDLVDSFTPPARIILLGSNTYRGTLGRRMMGAPGPDWRDPVEIAKPASGEKSPGRKAAGVAYATSKLAILYYAHELQRRVDDQTNVMVFEPGFMPGTGIGRDYSPAVQAMARAIAHLPGMSSPTRAAPALASVVLDDHWANLRDGAFVVLGKETAVLPHAHDRDRELRLWEATRELLTKTTIPS
jgi:NAD(P)-dependent dehydrogenase (short-subunit alcohol dehydrogenase family)